MHTTSDSHNTLFLIYVHDDIAVTTFITDFCRCQCHSPGGVGKSWGETLEELAKDIAARMPAQFDIERALILFPVR